jgi:hypothetical protein
VGAVRQMRGDGEAQAKYDIYVNCDLCGKRLRTGRRRESAIKHPSTGGNIGGRQRAELVAEGFDLCSWRRVSTP